MSNAEKKPTMIFLHLDRFQQMKRERMRCLLEELEQVGTIGIKDFLSHIAIHYGIRRTTGQEYIQDWLDAGCISVEDGKIKFLQKPKRWK